MGKVQTFYTCGAATICHTLSSRISTCSSRTSLSIARICGGRSTAAQVLPAAVNQGGPVRYGNAAQGGPGADAGLVPAMSGASGVYGVNPAQRGPYGGPQAAGGYGAPPQIQGDLLLADTCAGIESLLCPPCVLPQLPEA